MKKLCVNFGVATDLGQNIARMDRGLGSKTAAIALGGPCENRACESFDGKPRDELPGCEIFFSFAKAKAPIAAYADRDLCQVTAGPDGSKLMRPSLFS